MTQIRFVVRGLPVAQPRHKIRAFMPANGKRPIAQTYLPSSHPVNDWKEAIREGVTDAMQGRSPLVVALSVRLTFGMPRPSSKVWKRKAMPMYPHTAKPDVDNLAKAVLDALNGIAYLDDRQVAHLEVFKVVVSGEQTEGLECTITHLNDSTS